MERSNPSKLLVIEAVLVILSVTFSVRASNNLIMTSVPLLVRYDFGFSQTLVGIISALSSVSTFLSTTFINAKLKSSARRISFVLANALYAVALILFYLSTPYSVWIVTASAGAILGLIMPNLVTSASLFKDAVLRERVLALYTVSLSLSLICGPILESYLLTFVSLRTVFLDFSLFGLLATILSVFIKFPEDRRKGERTDVLRNHGFQVSLFNVMAYNIPFAILLTFAGIYEKDTFGISLSLVSVLFSIFFAASFCTRLFLFIRPARGVGRYMLGSMALSIAGIAIMIMSRNVLIFSVSLIMLGIPHGLSYPLSVLTISRSFRPEHRNIANSYFYSIMMFVGIMLPLIGGFLVDTITFRGTLLIVVFIIVALLLLTARTLVKWNIENKESGATKIA